MAQIDKAALQRRRQTQKARVASAQARKPKTEGQKRWRIGGMRARLAQARRKVLPP